MLGRRAALNLLRKLISRSPADQTEAVLLTEESSLTRFANSSVHQNVAEKNQTLILRVLLDRRMAAVVTNRLEQPFLERALERAISLAKVQQPRDQSFSFSEPKPIPQAETFFKAVRSLSPERKTKTIRQVVSIAGAKGCKVSGAFSNGIVEVAVVNSRGVSAYQKYSDVFFHMIAENERTTGYSSFVSRNPEEFDPESTAIEALSKVSEKDPVEIEAGEYEVILEPYAVAEIVLFLSYIGFHALAVQEKRSFMCDMFGKRIVDERLTIYDDGLDPHGLQIPFDFEGIPKQKVVFIDRGVAKDVTYDTATARKEGKQSTGHALIPPSTEGPVPINLIMEPGDTATLDEMIRSVRRGIYVTRFHYTNVVEPMKAVLTGMTRDGTFLIEDGELKNPVRNLRFTESMLEALDRVKAVSKERRLCTEGTIYSKRLVTATLVPALKIDGFFFSGIAKS